MLSKALQKNGQDFKPSMVNPCMFIRDDFVLLVYVDDVLIIGETKDDVSIFISSPKTGDEGFQFTEQGGLDHYLGVEVIQREGKHVKGRENLVHLPLLHKGFDGLKCKQSWYFRSAVCMLSYLQGTSHPEIAMGVHQCARFTNQPMLSHECALQQIVKYLSTTGHRGIVYYPDPNLGIQRYVEADCAGSWSKADADNPKNFMPCTGFVVMYAGCPVFWQSKL
eukprot:1978734-Ditylum_brightwellii.AAC.1